MILLCCLFIHFILPFGSTRPDGEGGQEAAEELMLRIQACYAASCDGIRLWEGVVKVRDKVTLLDTTTSRNADATFAYDRQRRAWRYTWQVSDSTIEARGQVRVGNLQNSRTAGMAIGDDFYHIPWYHPAANKPVATIQASRPHKHGDMTEAIDPLFFYRINGSEEIGSFFSALRTISPRIGEIVEMRRASQQILLSVRHAESKTHSEFTFDLSQGGLLTSGSSTDVVRTVSWKRGYQIINGIWVPIRSEYSNKRHDGSELHYREIVWHRQVVNTPLMVDTFSLNGIGLDASAIIQDHRLGQVYNGPEIIPGHEPLIESPPKSPRKMSVYLLLSAAVLASVFFLLRYILRRRSPAR
ncbi:hypothetical protein R5W24_004011 [Gemmata sp. JC717]|uniref:hypothetical protein n=1 Tax=Gemmata algarum TaxID=2975278 RepID=UPI0021BAA22A|nr:hypothetical protein [Gemmata algarum]MDY3554880.1 hypothetical protein [Gemmata algarum]